MMPTAISTSTSSTGQFRHSTRQTSHRIMSFTETTGMAPSRMSLKRRGSGGTAYGTGATVGDYDNDGDTDLYVTNFGADQLYQNNGDGTFRDVTTHAKVGNLNWGTSCAFADVDNDGHLDLYIANYAEWDTGQRHPLRRAWRSRLLRSAGISRCPRYFLQE